MDIIKCKIYNKIRFTYEIISFDIKGKYDRDISQLYHKWTLKGFNKFKYETEAQVIKDLMLQTLFDNSVENIEDIYNLKYH